jgi:hypothetical protein
MKVGPGASRDQDVSAFSLTLGRLCEGLPAVAAALVDAEGETVDYAGRRTPFDVRVTAAEVRLVLGMCAGAPTLCPGGAAELTIRARSASYAVFRLEEGYALVVELPRRAFAISRRALGEAVRELCHEAQLPVPAAFLQDTWTRLEVQEEPLGTRRPAALRMNGHWLTLEVLGRYRGPELTRREVAFRVRAENGLETTLVRECFGRWYADDLPASQAPDP